MFSFSQVSQFASTHHVLIYILLAFIGITILGFILYFFKFFNFFAGPVNYSPNRMYSPQKLNPEKYSQFQLKQISKIVGIKKPTGSKAQLIENINKKAILYEQPSQTSHGPKPSKTLLLKTKSSGPNGSFHPKSSNIKLVKINALYEPLDAPILLDKNAIIKGPLVSWNNHGKGKGATITLAENNGIINQSIIADTPYQIKSAKIDNSVDGGLAVDIKSKSNRNTHIFGFASSDKPND